MYPGMNMQISIDWQLKQIAKKYKSEIAAIDKAKRDNRELVRTLMRLAHDKPSEISGYLSLLPYYYIMKKEFVLACTVANYVTNHFYLSCENRFEQPEYWDLRLYWQKAGEENLTADEIRVENLKIKDSGKKIPWRINHVVFKLDNPQYNDNVINNTKQGGQSNNTYSLAPEDRYKTVDEERLYYVTFGSYPELRSDLCIYFAQEKYVETAECLFRLQHMVATGSKPKGYMEFPNISRLIPFALAYENWFNARFAKDPAHQKALAWTAVYWFVEDLLRNVSQRDGFSSMIYFISDAIEGLIGEFELMERDQAGFLENFKNEAMFASISFCRKMIDDPVRMIPFSERNLPTDEECKQMYDEMFPPPA